MYACMYFCCAILPSIIQLNALLQRTPAVQSYTAIGKPNA